jgi:hypothetical protein
MQIVKQKWWGDWKNRWSWEDRIKLALINLLNAELNPICYLLALLGAHPILHISRIRVKQ